jgi:hypothetical protein
MPISTDYKQVGMLRLFGGKGTNVLKITTETRRSRAIQGGKMAWINTNDLPGPGNWTEGTIANNTSIHEVMHLFGLSDRYNEFVKTLSSGDVINPAQLANLNWDISNALPGAQALSLSPSYDPQYFTNQTVNMMNFGLRVTDVQWKCVFSNRNEAYLGASIIFHNSRVMGFPIINVNFDNSQNLSLYTFQADGSITRAPKAYHNWYSRVLGSGSNGVIDYYNFGTNTNTIRTMLRF